MKRTFRTNERGFAVPLALLVIVALGMIGGAAAYMSAGDTNVAGMYASANRTSHAAAAGIEHAMGEYRQRVIEYDEGKDGEMHDYMLDMSWPVTGSIDGFDYSVVAERDSFDFDGDGDLEPVSCKGKGNTGNNGNDNNSNNGNNGNSGGGDTGNEDNGKYWKDEGKDKDGDGEAGLAGGHFDVDVWQKEEDKDDIKREYHQHEFDDKYDTNQADLRDHEDLLWEELFFGSDKQSEQTEYPGTVRLEFFNEDNASGTWEIKTTGDGTFEGDIGDGVTLEDLDPNKVLSFRVRFSTLMTFACTDPGSVDKDQVDRDGAYHLKMFDEESGELVYSWGAYWHEKEEECEEKKQQMEDDSSDDGGAGGSNDDGSAGSDDGNNGNNGNNGNANKNKNTCKLNGDGDGDPVFLLVSNATRESYRASQRLRVTSFHDSDQVLRLSWIGD